MQTNYVPAIFESGMLRPLAPLDLNEHEQVDIAIVRAVTAVEESDESYLPIIAAEADVAVTLEQVQRALAKIPGSLVEDFARQRDERF
jgi:predicted DNA-binding antitoxin AbrB/MazE fold protein